MKPRRLHRLTIFSIRWALVGALICHSQVTQIRKRCRGFCAKRLPIGSAADTAAATATWSGLYFDFDLGLDRISDKTLVVRGMIHFFEFLRRGLFIAGEFESLP